MKKIDLLLVTLITAILKEICLSRKMILLTKRVLFTYLIKICFFRYNMCYTRTKTRLRYVP